jgi:hypothetical protein
LQELEQWGHLVRVEQEHQLVLPIHGTLLVILWVLIFISAIIILSGNIK